MHIDLFMERWRGVTSSELTTAQSFVMDRLAQCPDRELLGRLRTVSVHGHNFATRKQARQAVMD